MPSLKKRRTKDYLKIAMTMRADQPLFINEEEKQEALLQKKEGEATSKKILACSKNSCFAEVRHDEAIEMEG